MSTTKKEQWLYAACCTLQAARFKLHSYLRSDIDYLQASLAAYSLQHVASISQLIARSLIVTTKPLFHIISITYKLSLAAYSLQHVAEHLTAHGS